MMSAGDALGRMLALPVVDFDELAPGTSMVIAPHADDETLGCGGLIASACLRGRPPVIVVVSDGVQSHPNSTAFPPSRLQAVREAELRAALSTLGADPARAHFLRLPDTAVPQAGPVFDHTVEYLVDLVRSAGIRTVFVTWRHDPHCDHQASAQIGMQVAQISGVALRFYPVWGWLLPRTRVLSETDIRGCRLDVRPLLDLKRKAVAAHASQYSDLITDDPDGFRLPPDLLAIFQRPYEVFLSP